MKRVLFRPQAARELERLPHRDRNQVEKAIERFARTGFGDVKMLEGQARQLGLRSGDWRVRFIYEKPDAISNASNTRGPREVLEFPPNIPVTVALKYGQARQRHVGLGCGW